ncbi:MAG: thioredoxin family protein [Promethearchaeati archaeon]|nr:MAG: thioredoxin [Candidatus Lokiarchaeota archaeon]
MNIEKLKEINIDITDEMKQGKTVIDVYTEWCGPCKFVSPILEKLSNEGLINLKEVDLDQNRPLGAMFNIHAIPTLLFFKDGNLLEHSIDVNGQTLVTGGKMVGAAGEEILRYIISQM